MVEGKQHRIAIGITCAIVLGAFLSDPPWKWYHTAESVPFWGEPLHVAKSLLSGDGFSNPYAPLATGPTAHIAPIFPALQFVILRFFGTGALGWLFIRALAGIAFVVELALLPWFAQEVGLSVWTGGLAAIGGILAKPAREELWEAHLAGLAALLLTFAMVRSAEDRSSRKTWIFCGLMAGLCVLLQPVILAVLVTFLIFLYIRTKPGQVILVAACAFLVCIPWLVRNYRQVGSVNIRNGLGLVLYVSFNDCTPYGVRESERSGCYETMAPNASLREAQEILRLGEQKYNADRLDRAIHWMSQHPRRGMILIAQRFWFFWFPSDSGVAGYLSQPRHVLISHLLTVLSICALFVGGSKSWKLNQFLYPWLAIYPLIYYVALFETRYRLPILWCTWLLAAALLDQTFRRRFGNTDQRVGR